MRKVSTIDQIAAIFAISPSFLFIPLFLCIFFLYKKKKRREKGKKKTKITSEKQMLQEHTGYGKIRMILQYRKNSEYRKELKKKKEKK